MELREWLIILGLALVSLIVIDGIRRLKRQRRVPRLDQADHSHTEDNEIDPEEAKRQAEINWELPNGGARVVKSADYSHSAAKPKLQRQEHPGPSRVLSEFRRHKTTLADAELSDPQDKQRPVHKVDPAERADKSAEASEASIDESSVSHQSTNTASTTFPSVSKVAHADVPPLKASESEPNVPTQPLARMTAVDDVSPDPHVSSSDPQGLGTSLQRDTSAQHDTRRRQLRSSTVGDCSDEVDEEDTYYQLVDFHGIKDSFKHRMHARLEEHKQKKLEKIKRKELLKTEKAKRVAEAEKREAQRAKEEAERRREAQLQAEAARADQAAREVQASGQNLPQGDFPAGFEHPDKHHPVDHDGASSGADLDPTAPAYGSGRHSHIDTLHHEDADEDVVRPHPTLAKAMRHDLSGRQAADTLQNAEEVIVISVMCRDEDGFEGDKLLELLMMCGLRYSSDMGIFHRLETEHPESELQFSMVNVVKPGTFPIQEMDTFLTPGVTFLMPLPGAEDSSAAFEAMVETAMVVVRHMGGELKDENRSVMTAQTIEFARQRVHEFERRHHLHRAQAN